MVAVILPPTELEILPFIRDFARYLRLYREAKWRTVLIQNFLRNNLK